ncbi:type III pantothenate kinase [uncultured Microscilla sp.]|uniref:type III pantothenate kinase n=1 Tax=uncultured Microscilla sp. TaxID=432653 RepID=UPI002621C094|nr:type III pantothenate kinase [uncultured Microscilla sp.]
MHPLNLCIDLGNTTGKAAFFRQQKMLEYHEQLSEKSILHLVQKEQPHYIIISSVRSNLDNLLDQLKQYSKVVVLDSTLPVPMINHYETPHTLGTDRIAGVVGARVLYPQDSCLVIDAGTCITYDFIDQQNNYFGGSISLGLQMRFKALHHYTDRLPLIEAATTRPALVGTSTPKAMLSGVINGLVAEIEGVIAGYSEIFGNFAPILCGGDAAFFESKIKESIFVASNLILIGLNRILIYNVENKLKS